MAGYLVTFGVRPNAPATSYGYIRPGAKIGGSPAHVVEAFVEKPDQATATRYVAEGFLWNSGNFLFRANRMLDELAQFEPQMFVPPPSSRSMRSRAISIFCACPNKRSCAPRRNRSTMQ
jgi:mannose-1-phosphate guanylyltransferase